MKALILIALVSLFAGCSSDSTVVIKKHRGFYMEENDIQALEDIQTGFNSNSCSNFQTSDSEYMLLGYDVSRSGRITIITGTQESIGDTGILFGKIDSNDDFTPSDFFTTQANLPEDLIYKVQYNDDSIEFYSVLTPQSEDSPFLVNRVFKISNEDFEAANSLITQVCRQQ